MPKKVNIQKLRDKRINEDSMLEIRSHRTHMLSAWHARIDKIDQLYQGKWDVVFPGELTQQELPHVMNLVQVAMDDVARLTSESRPAVRCFPENDKEEEQKNAYLREAIAETYWERNHGDLLAPKLAMDLIGTGTCFAVVDTAHEEYPCIHRVDPRMAFPDTHNGELVDLLVSQTMKIRVAAQIFPRLELERYDNPEICDSAEVLEYYSKDECVQAVVLTKDNKPIPEGYIEVKHWDPGGVVPVAFAMLDSFDGEFRGMFDQVFGSLKTKNRIVKLMMDYTDQLVYAPLVSKGLLNPEEGYGPNAHYRLDPNIPDAQMGRLQPGGSSPQLFNILEYLDREQRAGVSFPAQRQGDVSQSIASASFVASTQGQLTSTVRNIQRLLSSFRETLNYVCFKLDETFLDNPKPLVRPVGKKKQYSPSRDIRGQCDSMVLYGAGAGLDRLNADVRVLQHLGAGLISKETARGQIDYLAQDGEEGDQINREMAESAMAQKFLMEAPWEVVAQAYKKMGEGLSLPDAITAVIEEQAQQEGGMPQAAPAQTGGAPAAPESAQTEQLALQKGRTGANAPASEPKFKPEPLTNILVRPS